MEKLAFDIFFEKVAMPPIGKAMGMVLPLGFMALTGMDAVKKVAQPAGGIGRAINLPQTMNRFQNF